MPDDQDEADDLFGNAAASSKPPLPATAKDDHHDRIDFILARAKNLTVISAGIVGEKAPEADLVVTPWPSDHRASMAVVSF